MYGAEPYRVFAIAHTNHSHLQWQESGATCSVTLSGTIPTVINDSDVNADASASGTIPTISAVDVGVDADDSASGTIPTIISVVDPNSPSGTVPIISAVDPVPTILPTNTDLNRAVPNSNLSHEHGSADNHPNATSHEAGGDHSRRAAESNGSGGGGGGNGEDVGDGHDGSNSGDGAADVGGGDADAGADAGVGGGVGAGAAGGASGDGGGTSGDGDGASGDGDGASGDGDGASGDGDGGVGGVGGVGGGKSNGDGVGEINEGSPVVIHISKNEDPTNVSVVTNNSIELKLEVDLQSAVKGLTVHRLAAREVIRDIHDRDYPPNGRSAKANITEWGETYSILSKYTSFIAVDKRTPLRIQHLLQAFQQCPPHLWELVDQYDDDGTSPEHKRRKNSSDDDFVTNNDDDGGDVDNEEKDNDNENVRK